MFVVRFKNSRCWLAPWTGDPGRTLLLCNAKRFKKIETAEAAIRGAMKKYSKFRDMTLEVMELTDKHDITKVSVGEKVLCVNTIKDSDKNVCFESGKFYEVAIVHSEGIEMLNDIPDLHWIPFDSHNFSIEAHFERDF